MRFQSRYTKITYTPQASHRRISPAGTDLGNTKPLRAKFRSPLGEAVDGEGNALETKEPSFFDSQAAQKELGWSDEERHEVEKHLLLHRDFGVGLYLATGEKIPPEHEDVIPELVERGVLGRSDGDDSVHGDDPEKSIQCCAEVVDAEGPRRCRKRAKKGSDLCSTHEGELAETGAGAVA